MAMGHCSGPGIMLSPGHDMLNGPRAVLAALRLATRSRMYGYYGMHDHNDFLA